MRMRFRDLPIQKKLLRVIFLVSGMVLVLSCTAYFIYELVNLRQNTIRELSTLGRIIASNSTAALAFDNREDARHILSSVEANPYIVAAALYDRHGKLFSSYPENLNISLLPEKPENEGYYFRQSHIVGFQPVVQKNRVMGTLFLKFDLAERYDRFKLYGFITLLITGFALLLAYVLSSVLQKQISGPILSLTQIARAVSERQDYSVRATSHGRDEIGLLTSAFNHMLERIEAQNLSLITSENRVRAVINAALSAVVVIDSNGFVLDWNARAEKMFGWKRDEALGGDLLEMVIPEAHRDRLRGYLRNFRTSNGGSTTQTTEMKALRRSGDEFPAEVSISQIISKEGVTYCCFITDITSRKKAEAEIRSFNRRLELKVIERTRELEAANKELEAFSYSVSHDLRAPLRSIHGYMNIFKEEYGDGVDKEARRLIEIVLKNSLMMGQLIDDLLVFSRLGRKELVKGEIDMFELVQNVVEDFRQLEKGRTIRFRVDPLPNAYGDQITIKQVWANLISNAVKYTRNTEVAEIHIGFEEKEHEVIYFIRDNGAGFEMQYYSKLFGVFQRLHSIQEFDGTGVGLAIVHRIITKHGGKVWAEGKRNEGAVFYFSLARKMQ